VVLPGHAPDRETNHHQYTIRSPRREALRAALAAEGIEVEVVALRSGAKAVVYVTSPWIVYPAGALRYNPQRIEGKTLTLLDWPDGPARAFWVSPATGNLREITRGQAEHGVASLPIPSFNEDLVGVVQSESTIPSR